MRRVKVFSLAYPANLRERPLDTPARLHVPVLFASWNAVHLPSTHPQHSVCVCRAACCVAVEGESRSRKHWDVKGCVHDTQVASSGKIRRDVWRRTAHIYIYICFYVADSALDGWLRAFFSSFRVLLPADEAKSRVVERAAVLSVSMPAVLLVMSPISRRSLRH